MLGYEDRRGRATAAAPFSRAWSVKEFTRLRDFDADRMRI
jgi:hypothetical protein